MGVLDFSFSITVDEAAACGNVVESCAGDVFVTGGVDGRLSKGELVLDGNGDSFTIVLVTGWMTVVDDAGLVAVRNDDDLAGSGRSTVGVVNVGVLDTMD